MSEEIYKNLTGSAGTGLESVHLEEYPQFDEKLIDEELSFRMNVARRIIGLGRSVRSKVSIKTRQPLASVKVYFDNKDRERNISACNYFREVILEELNVKELEIIENLENLVFFNIKPNLKLLGPKYGAYLPGIRQILESRGNFALALKAKNEKVVNIMVQGKQIELLPEELIVEIKNLKDYGIESDSEITVGLPLVIPETLKEEGFCRELVHQIQNLRKEAGFQIENTIITAIDYDDDIKKVVEKYVEYIMKETLSKKLSNDFTGGMFVKEIKVNDRIIKTGIKVCGSIV